MSYHPITEKITSILKENNCWFETFEHAPVRTSEEAAKVRTGYVLHQGAKTIIVRVKKKRLASAEATAEQSKHFVMFIVPGDQKFDKNKIKSEFGLNDLRFALEDEVAEITGNVLPGGVPPFGNLFGLEVYMDKGVLENEKIIFNAGDRSFSVAMKAVDYVKLVNPKIGSIV